MTSSLDSPSRPRRLGLLAALLLLTLVIGAAGARVTVPNIPVWYAGLTKPWFTPPNAVFGPVWTTLYILMAVAAWRVWIRRPPAPRRGPALTLFFVQLALNAVWSPVFFALHAPAAALAVIVLLLVALVPTTLLFWRIDRPAGLLLVPYLAWVGYASLLNGAIVVLNPPG